MEFGQFVQLDQALMGYFVFGLVLTRMGGMVMSSQFFSSMQIPTKYKAIVAIFFTLTVYPTARTTWHWDSNMILNASDIGFLVCQELIIGVAIGFLSNIIYGSVQLAGQLCGQQIGFAMSTVMDPLSNLNVSLIGYLWAQIAGLVFLILNLHLYIIWLLDRSYEIIGIGDILFPYFLASVIEGSEMQIELMFKATMQVAMPIVAITLIISVIIGFVTRTMPQMNIMVFGMPLRVTLGLLSVMLLIPGVCTAFAGAEEGHIWFDNAGDGLWHEMLEILSNTIAHMAPDQPLTAEGY